MTTTVNDIEHIESQSYNGVAVIKLYFQPNVKVELAIAQVTAIVQTHSARAAARHLPAQYPEIRCLKRPHPPDRSQQQHAHRSGTLRSTARTSSALSWRPSRAPFPCLTAARTRQIMVDFNPDALYRQAALRDRCLQRAESQNLILPAGTAKIGKREYLVRVNSSPLIVAELNELPIKSGQRRNRLHEGRRTGARRLRGCRPTSCAERQPRRLLTILKNGQASTLSIIGRVKKAIPENRRGLPSSLKMTFLSDQSLFVRASIEGVLREGAIAAGPHRHHDPAVSGKPAQHRDRLHFDPALDHDFAHRAQRDWVKRSTS